MKFISFIASTILIVLIIQQSTIGLPLNETIVEESCPKGLEMIDGHCLPIKSKKSYNNEIESSSFTTEYMIIHEHQQVMVENSTVRYGACPKGMEHGKHGICQEIEFSETTEATFEATTESDKNFGGEEPRKDCPEGTEHDEQGACQEIKPSKSANISTDPKFLLTKNGSCPDSFKMIEGRCLYIKPKTNLKSHPIYLAADDIPSNGIRPKNANDGSVKLESVPVLSDNSCPEGTDYSEYGLCQKHVRPLSSDGFCPANYELIHGECKQKKSKVQNLLDLTTKISRFESTTLRSKPINNDKSTFTRKSTTEATIVEESPPEFESQATSSPL